MPRRGTSPPDPTNGEVEITFVLTPQEVELLVRGLHNAADDKPYEAIEDDYREKNTIKAFAAAIQEQADRGVAFTPVE